MQRSFAILVVVLQYSANPVAGEDGDSLRDLVKKEFSRPQDPGGMVFSYAETVEKTLPAVVTVVPVKYVTPQAEDDLPGEFDLSRRKQSSVPEEVRGTGSGVIITTSGYLLTNDHVIEGASKVMVRRSGYDGEIPAEVVGSDALTDVAVLKIEGIDLPIIPFADSSMVRQGDLVLALGSPFGLDQTVTLGIVSATGRNMHFIKGGYEDFIQTDASINPGNSGGALVDALGRLVGVNSSRYPDEFGNSTGIGFAIPSNMALRVADDLMCHGRVRRGFLGIRMEVEQATGEKQSGNIRKMSPIRVTEIENRSPADKAGFRVDDLIETMGGKQVTTVDKLRYALAISEPGTEVKFKVNREGGSLLLSAILGEAPLKSNATMAPLRSLAKTPSVVLQLGLEVANMTAGQRQDANLPAKIHGAQIIKAENEVGEPLGILREGDVITAINGRVVNSSNEAAVVFGSAPSGTVMFRLWREKQETFGAITKTPPPTAPAKNPTR